MNNTEREALRAEFERHMDSTQPTYWRTTAHAREAWALWQAARATQPGAKTEPLDAVLHCPVCGLQHLDELFKPGDVYTNHCPEKVLAKAWTNPPHRSHLCLGCGHIWRPADVPTNGVVAVKTKGKADSPTPAVGGAEIHRFAPLVQAVVDFLCAVDEQHDSKGAPLKYTVPWGALNRLRVVVSVLKARRDK